MMSKSFPAWTVPRDFWKQALQPEISRIAVDIRLFHESGHRLVHKYRVYRDPVPHPALREGRVTKLISLVNRAMVIAKLTHLHIAIPSLGNPPGEVPRVDDHRIMKRLRRVSFAPVCQTSMGKTNPLTTDQDTTPTESLALMTQPGLESPRIPES